MYLVSTNSFILPIENIVEKLKTYETTTKETKGKNYENCIFMQKYKSTKTIMSMQHVRIEE